MADGLASGLSGLRVRFPWRQIEPGQHQQDGQRQGQAREEGAIGALALIGLFLFPGAGASFHEAQGFYVQTAAGTLFQAFLKEPAVF